MQLDYVSSTEAFVVRVPRSSGSDIQSLMREHGLDFSIKDSTAETAVLFTREPYAAATFWEYATERAKLELGGIYAEIQASWAPTSEAHISTPPDKNLWPFQRASVEYALRRKNTLVGDQPGLGKTPIAICFANEIRAKRVLVICPASIRVQWVMKIREWSTMKWPLVIHPILHSRHGVHPLCDGTGSFQGQPHAGRGDVEALA